MPDVTVHFSDGSQPITYRNAPASTSQLDVMKRVGHDYPDRIRSIHGIEGAQESSMMDRLKAFATEGQVGEHGVLSSDLPQLLRGVGDTLSLGATGDMSPPQTTDEKDSRTAGRELPLAVGRGVGSTSLLKPPNFSGGSWSEGAASAAKMTASKPAAGADEPGMAKQILNSPVTKMIAKAAGFGSGVELVQFLSKHL